VAFALVLVLLELQFLAILELQEFLQLLQHLSTISFAFTHSAAVQIVVMIGLSLSVVVIGVV
jgi:hypothetical protein